jgi:Flp pilus assembly protein TadD
MPFFASLRANKNYAEGTVALQRGEVESAIKGLSKAVRLKPDWPEARHNLGNALIAAADLHGMLNPRSPEVDGFAARALEEFNEAIRLRHRFPEAHNNRGRALVKLERFVDADSAFAEALQQRPGYASAIENREWLRGQVERLKDALEEIDEGEARRLRERVQLPPDG